MILRDQHLLVEVDLPQEGYQGTRFDWTGKIVRLEWKGIPLTTTESEAGESEKGKGLYNEFCMDSLLGFEEAMEGEWCHKIGIGLLKKEGTAYLFHQSYDLRPAKFTHQASDKKLVMRCTGDLHEGFGYELVKTIELCDDGLTIEYELTNTGEKTIHTTEYTHNFLAINHLEMGEGYSLLLPSPTVPGEFGEFVNPDATLSVQSSSVVLHRPATQPFFISHVCGQQSTPAAWQLIHAQILLALSEEVSFPAQKINLWGTSHVISPELFVEIHVAPGNTTSWTRSYRINKTPE